MRFLSVHIQNLFSYQDGLFIFPDSIASGKNVILIHGRNGFGKTSFINALKLFFLGGNHPEMRSNSHGRHFSLQNYILGDKSEWEGVFNRKAMLSQEQECSITVTWKEAQGIVTGKRAWTRTGSTVVTETLKISPSFSIDEDMLEEPEQHQEFLARRLPPALVPFFIYDAEQVQRIAETNTEVMTEQIERLLDITAINTAETYLAKALQKLRRDSNARQEQHQLEKLRAEYDRACADKNQIESQIEDIERDDAEHKRRITELERRLQKTKAGKNENNEDFFKMQVDNMKLALEEKTGHFLDTFPEVAPLLCHPQIIAKTLDKLKLVAQGRQQLADELRAIMENLPGKLFDEKPFPLPILSEAQRQFLKQKFSVLFDTEIKLMATTGDTETWVVGPDRARHVSAQLSPFAGSNMVRDGFVTQLRDISKLIRDDLQIKTQLEDFSKLPKGDREKQEERKAERDALIAISNDLREKIGGLRERLIPISRDIEKRKSEVNYQERKVVEATRNQTGVDIAERALNGIRIFKGALKLSKQKEIQTWMNRHFMELMDSHKLVQTITFDEDFKMKYLDKANQPIGMSSISAGMKQIAAQALLWALKDAAGSPCPVVIDTPLARIDAGHQKLLITKFYPAVAEQVIVLPTDSELDATKYAMLKPFICAEFALSNPEGDATTVMPGVPMHHLGGK